MHRPRTNASQMRRRLLVEREDKRQNRLEKSGTRIVEIIRMRVQRKAKIE